MKLTIHDRTDEAVKFTLADTSVSFANALRRVLLSEIPTLSIDLVEIEKNYTVISDEMIAHRLGLIPIHSGDTLKYKEECLCSSYCDQCAVIGTIDVYNGDSSVRFVTSKDIHFERDGMIRVRNPSLIAKLSTHQSLKVKAIVRKGIAKTHAKWCPVTAVGFEYDKENRKRDTELWYNESVNKEWPMQNQEDADILGETKEVDMEVEVVEGVLEPVETLGSALEILKEKVDMLVKALEAEEY